MQCRTCRTRSPVLFAHRLCGHNKTMAQDKRRYAFSRFSYATKHQQEPPSSPSPLLRVRLLSQREIMLCGVNMFRASALVPRVSACSALHSTRCMSCVNVFASRRERRRRSSHRLTNVTRRAFDEWTTIEGSLAPYQVRSSLDLLTRIIRDGYAPGPGSVSSVRRALPDHRAGVCG